MFVVKPKKNNLIRDYRRNDEPESVINMEYSNISDKNIQLAALTLNIPLYKYYNYSIEEIEKLARELIGGDLVNDDNIYYKKIKLAKDIIIEDKRKNMYNTQIKEKKDINNVLFNTSNPNTKLNNGLIIQKSNTIDFNNNNNNTENNSDLLSILNNNKQKNNNHHNMNNNINNNLINNNHHNINNHNMNNNNHNNHNNHNNNNNKNIKINDIQSTSEIVDYDILSDPRAQNVDRRLLNNKFKKPEDYEDNVSMSYIDYTMMNKQKRRFNNV
jgi:hypothetical protein